MKTRFFSLSSLLLPSLTFLLIFCATQVATAQVPSYVPTNGLVGYWPFNGNANDESGNGNNGTVNEAVLTADRFGNANSSYEYNTPDCQITTNAFFNASLDFTFTCWFYSNSNTSQILLNTIPHTVIAYGVNSWFAGPNFTSFLYGSGQSFGWFNEGNSSYLSPNSLLNNWRSLTVVKSGSNYMFYENGVLTFSHIIVQQPTSQLCQLVFGHCDPTECQEALTGFLDDFGIWNRALTADEVLALYNGCNVVPIAIAGSNTPGAFSTSTYTCDNNAGSTYNWTVSNGVIASGQGTNSVSILWGAEGVGSVSVVETTANGCVGDAVVYDVNVQCIVSGNAIEGPVGPEAFSNSTYTCNGAANSNYNWTITNGVIVSGQGTNSVTVLWASNGLGNISVIETTAEGCVGTTLSQDVVVVPVSVEEFITAFSLFPNPATTEVNLQTTAEMIGSDLIIFDALGKQIHKQQIISTNSRINTSAFAAGNYVVKVGEGVKRFEVKK
ncbi:MAG: hypothetical protein RLZZ71_1140 [Bacteroidota bacterium]|jgi:hypothetical protein